MSAHWRIKGFMQVRNFCFIISLRRRRRRRRRRHCCRCRRCRRLSSAFAFRSFIKY